MVDIHCDEFSKKALSEDAIRNLKDHLKWHLVFQHSKLSEPFIKQLTEPDD